MFVCCFVVLFKSETRAIQERRDKRRERQKARKGKKKLYCINYSDNKSDRDNSYELLKLREQGVERRRRKKELLVNLNNRLNEQTIE